jgi:hypothetical protein
VFLRFYIYLHKGQFLTNIRARAQAWALRRLVEWEPFLKRDESRTSTRPLLELMAREHMDGLRNDGMS